ALTNLAAPVQDLLVQVYKGAEADSAEAAAKTYKLSPEESGRYSLQDLPLGEHVLLVSLLDKDGHRLAEARLQLSIVPGVQVLPAITLQPIDQEQVGLKLELALNLVNFPSLPKPDPVEPASVRAVLKAYRCQNCHSTANPISGLNLQVFPYQTQDQQSLQEILTKILNSVEGLEGAPIMPPRDKPTVKMEDLASLKDFIKQVNSPAEVHIGDWVKSVEFQVKTGVFNRGPVQLILKDDVYVLAEPISIVATQPLSYSLRVFGADGKKLYEVSDVVLDLPADGKIGLKIDINYQSP
ncbi:MAG: hypothetical protein NTX25_10920, partial [Proteobacteria bacterium]|nr:hypothetical protein [Pseudomonadota bacterium]